MVDDQTETYTTELLRDLKRNHEKWVEGRLKTHEPEPVRVRRISANVPTALRRITSGKELLQVTSGSFAHTFDHDSDLSEDEAALIGSFAQNVIDFGEFASDMEIPERMRTTATIEQMLNGIHDSGFMVFAAREVQQMTGGASSAPSPFPVVHLRVLRSTNPDIMKTE